MVVVLGGGRFLGMIFFKDLVGSAVFTQIALAIGVLTSSWGVRFCGFVAGGAVTHSVVGGVVWCV